jgi:hypothetical protein
MDDSKTRAADQAPQNTEATSKKTLAEIEQTEEDFDTSSEDSNAESQSPSPDGSLDEADEIKDAGPM